MSAIEEAAEIKETVADVLTALSRVPTDEAGICAAPVDVYWMLQLAEIRLKEASRLMEQSIGRSPPTQLRSAAWQGPRINTPRRSSKAPRVKNVHIVHILN
jgi:hypothetical protein